MLRFTITYFYLIARLIDLQKLHPVFTKVNIDFKVSSEIDLLQNM